MQTYSTRTEAIAREIVERIQDSGEITNAYEAFNVEAIADEVLGGHPGFALRVDIDTFWQVVQKHKLPARLTKDELRAARSILGLSGQQLARRLWVRSDTVRRWENGRDAVPYRVRSELVEIARERAAAITALGKALEATADLPLTPETVVESKGWRGSLQELQDWLWNGNSILEANLIAGLRDTGRIEPIDQDDDDAVEADDVSFLSVLPVLTFQDVKDVLDDPRAKIVH